MLKTKAFIDICLNVNDFAYEKFTGNIFQFSLIYIYLNFLY